MGKQSRTKLEIFKFSLYVFFPFLAVYTITKPQSLEAVIMNRKYIEYPPEADRPPSSIKEVKSYMQKHHPSPPSSSSSST